MTPQELVQLLRDTAPYASLAVILIAGWRLFRRIHEAETKLGGLANDLGEINSVLVQVRLDAEKVGRSLPEQVQGLEHFHKWDTRHVRSLMRSAKTRIWILQTWFPEMEADINEWKFDHPRSLDVRILMAAESNPAVLERVRFRGDFRKDHDDDERKSHIKQVADACEAMIRQKLEGHRVQGKIARYEHGMPFGPIYLIDDHAIFGIYPPHQNCNYAPMLRVPAATPTGELVREAFETFWDSTLAASPDEGGV
jgi:hypothetical protein